jgi:phage tail-like protein
VASTGDRADPFIAFRFEVSIAGIPAGGFSDCTGLTVETEVTDYQEGGRNNAVLKLIGRTKQTNLVLKRGVVSRDLWDWYFDVVEGRIEKRSGSVILRDPSGNDSVMEFEFADAFPMKWTGPDLNASQSAVAVESLEVVHSGLRRKR